jgi:hypothetical protein
MQKIPAGRVFDGHNDVLLRLFRKRGPAIAQAFLATARASLICRVC